MDIPALHSYAKAEAKMSYACIGVLRGGECDVRLVCGSPRGTPRMYRVLVLLYLHATGSCPWGRRTQEAQAYGRTAATVGGTPVLVGDGPERGRTDDRMMHTRYEMRRERTVWLELRSAR